MLNLLHGVCMLNCTHEHEHMHTHICAYADASVSRPKTFRPLRTFICRTAALAVNIMYRMHVEVEPTTAL